jgi:hypothetical protein
MLAQKTRPRGTTENLPALKPADAGDITQTHTGTDNGHHLKLYGPAKS